MQTRKPRWANFVQIVRVDYEDTLLCSQEATKVFAMMNQGCKVVHDVIEVPTHTRVINIPGLFHVGVVLLQLMYKGGDQETICHHGDGVTLSDTVLTMQGEGGAIGFAEDN